LFVGPQVANLLFEVIRSFVQLGLDLLRKSARLLFHLVPHQLAKLAVWIDSGRRLSTHCQHLLRRLARSDVAELSGSEHLEFAEQMDH